MKRFVSLFSEGCKQLLFGDNIDSNFFASRFIEMDKSTFITIPAYSDFIFTKISGEAVSLQNIFMSLESCPNH